MSIKNKDLIILIILFCYSRYFLLYRSYCEYADYQAYLNWNLLSAQTNVTEPQMRGLFQNVSAKWQRRHAAM